MLTVRYVTISCIASLIITTQLQCVSTTAETGKLCSLILKRLYTVYHRNWVLFYKTLWICNVRIP